MDKITVPFPAIVNSDPKECTMARHDPDQEQPVEEKSTRP